jgi:hypothetical protein
MQDLTNKIHALHVKYFESLDSMEQVQQQLGTVFRIYKEPHDPLGSLGVLRGIAEAVLKDKYHFMIVEYTSGKCKVVITEVV